MELAVEPIYHMTTDYNNVEGHNDLLSTSIVEAFPCKNRNCMFCFHVRLKLFFKKKFNKKRRGKIKHYVCFDKVPHLATLYVTHPFYALCIFTIQIQDNMFFSQNPLGRRQEEKRKKKKDNN